MVLSQNSVIRFELGTFLHDCSDSEILPPPPPPPSKTTAGDGDGGEVASSSFHSFSSAQVAKRVDHWRVLTFTLSWLVFSGQTIQFFGRNAETETALVGKTKILAETEILAESFFLAKRHYFGRNTLFWPRNTLFWPKQMFRTKTRE